MIYLYRIYQLFVMAPILLVATVITAIITIIGCVAGGGKWFGYYPARTWGKLFCWLSLVKIEVRGRHNIKRGTSYVFVANHQGAYDIFSIYGFLDHPFRWMMKASLRTIPLVGYACEKSHQIYVDKSSPKALKSTMQRAEAVLQKGISLVVFPEGARTFDGKMKRFKRGAFILAQEFNLPIVPITIDGSFSVMPRFKKIPHWGRIILTIHEPIMPPPGGYDIQAIMDLSAGIIGDSLPESCR